MYSRESPTTLHSLWLETLNLEQSILFKSKPSKERKIIIHSTTIKMSVSKTDIEVLNSRKRTVPATTKRESALHRNQYDLNMTPQHWLRAVNLKTVVFTANFITTAHRPYRSLPIRETKYDCETENSDNREATEALTVGLHYLQLHHILPGQPDAIPPTRVCLRNLFLRLIGCLSTLISDLWPRRYDKWLLNSYRPTYERTVPSDRDCCPI